jgi:hypothetical protein
VAVLKREEKERLLKKLSNYEKIEKEVSLSWDGSNLILRLPKEVADYLNVNKDNRFTKSLKFIIEENKDGIRKQFDIIERKTPKRKIR